MGTLTIPLPVLRTSRRGAIQFTVVASIGPALHGIAQVSAAIRRGANGLRHSFGYRDERSTGWLQELLEARSEGRIDFAMILDLPSTRLRLGHLSSEQIRLRPSDRIVVIDSDHSLGDELPVPGIGKLLPQVRVGDRILIRDGTTMLQVREIRDRSIRGEVIFSSEPLRSSNNILLPDSNVRYSALSPQDPELLDRFSGYLTVRDYICASFVEDADGVNAFRAAVYDSCHGSRPAIMAKIETPSAIRQAAEVIRASDAVMIGRGDLGLQVSAHELVSCQARIAHLGRFANKPVLIATQILESYARTGIVNRAELSDIATAIHNGAAGIVLCSETSGGKYPLETIRLACDVISVESTRCMGDVGAFGCDPKARGLYPVIAIEGADGTGKSMVAGLLADRLEGTRIPTPLDGYRALRPFFEERGRSVESRFLFYLGSLWDVWQQVEKSRVTGPVILDRYLLSTQIYHEVLSGRDLTCAMRTASPPLPDLTIILEAAPEIAATRNRTRRGTDFDFRMESDLDLQRRVAGRFRGSGCPCIATDRLTEKGVADECIALITRQFHGFD